MQAFGPRPGAAGSAVACLARAVIPGAVWSTGIRHNTAYLISAGYKASYNEQYKNFAAYQ